MTATAPRPPLDAVVVGDGFAAARMGAALRRTGVAEFATLGRDTVDYVFDADADRWRVRAHDGREFQPRILILAPGTESPDTSTFLGVASHGLPNLFFAESDPQAAYVAKCLALLERTGSTRIEVRAGTQHEFNRRLHAQPGRSGLLSRRALRQPKPGHFDLTVPSDRERPGAYRGPAVLDAAGAELPVAVVLSGYRDPIDGRYHWHGRLWAADPAAELPDPSRAAVLLGLPGRDPVPARLAELDPWGNLRITGVGEPPFPL